MLRIILASNNKGKITEINQLVSNIEIEVVPQSDYEVTEIEETGLTFIENALLKARHAASETKLPAMADDSGLVVPRLAGEPGIFSARYAGKEANHEKNIQKLLMKMKGLTGIERAAYFYCVIVFLRHATDPCPLVCEGIWQGQILETPRGDKGFGYDPIFFDPTHQCSAAELTADKKNKISHRGQAMGALVKKLQGLMEA